MSERYPFNDLELWQVIALAFVLVFLMAYLVVAVFLEKKWESVVSKFKAGGEHQ